MSIYESCKYIIHGGIVMPYLRAARHNPAVSSSNKSLYERVRLHFRNAILNNDVKFVSDALRTFADTSVLTKPRFLTVAVMTNNLEITRLLLEKGADANAMNGIALQEACREGRSRMVKLLLSHGANPNLNNKSSLVLAVKHKDLKIAEALLDGGADPNFNNGEPLLTAVKQGDHKMISLLCRRGANPNHNDDEALLLAEKKKHRRCLLSLVYYSSHAGCLQSKESQELVRSVLSYKMDGVRDFEPKQILCFSVKSQEQKDWEYLDKLQSSCDERRTGLRV